MSLSPEEQIRNEAVAHAVRWGSGNPVQLAGEIEAFILGTGSDQTDHLTYQQGEVELRDQLAEYKQENSQLLDEVQRLQQENETLNQRLDELAQQPAQPETMTMRAEIGGAAALDFNDRQQRGAERGGEPKPISEHVETAVQQIKKVASRDGIEYRRGEQYMPGEVLEPGVPYFWESSDGRGQQGGLARSSARATVNKNFINTYYRAIPVESQG